MAVYKIPDPPVKNLKVLGMLGDREGIAFFLSKQTDKDLEYYRHWYLAKIFNKKVAGQRSLLIERIYLQIIAEMKSRGLNVNEYSSDTKGSSDESTQHPVSGS